MFKIDASLAHLSLREVCSNRMLKKSASFVLASFRGSEALEGFFRSPRSILQANGHTKCGRYLLASSLAAAALDSHFEHPALRSCNVTVRKVTVKFEEKLSFSAAC
jgi:hypothetical protein